MAIVEPIRGKFVVLRTAEEDDAEFTLKIRQDPELTKYIPRLEGTIEGQRVWIRNQRAKKYDVFFVMEDTEGNRVGTISVYSVDMENKTCETGRWVSYGDSLMNIESELLLYDYVFSKIGIEKVNFEVISANKKVWKLHEKIGAQFIKEVDLDGTPYRVYNLLPKNFYDKSKFLSDAFV